MATRRDPGTPRQYPLPHERNLALISNIEIRLELPRGFLLALRNDESDWGFVIKIHALIETAVTDGLIRHIDKPTLERQLRKLNFTTKQRLAKDAGLLPGGGDAFLQEIGSARNGAAHDVRTAATFSLDVHFKGLSNDRKVSLVGGRLDEGSASAGAVRSRVWERAISLIAELEVAEIAAELLGDPNFKEAIRRQWEESRGLSSDDK